MLAAVYPVPWGLGALATAVLGVVAVRLTSAWRRHAAGQRSLGAVRTAPAADDLVVVADDRADSYALPGRPGRIVVTSGMLRTLSAEERAVLLAHERAHVTHSHHRYWPAGPTSAPRGLLRHDGMSDSKVCRTTAELVIMPTYRPDSVSAM